MDCGLLDLYLKQVKDIGGVQPVVAQPVQQLHLSASGEILEGSLAKRVGLPLFQLPAVADDVAEIAAERPGSAKAKREGEVR